MVGDVPDQAFFKAIIENSPLVVVRLSGDGLRVRYISANCTRLFGWSPDVVLGSGWSWLDVVHPDDLEQAAADFKAFLADPSTPMTAYFRISQGEGTDRWAVARFRQDPTAEGDLLGFLLDVHDRVTADSALRVAKEEAEQANQAKSEFLSRVSHELRTPLNSILGFAQLLELDELEEHQAEAVGQILKGGRHLLDVINEMLDLSRIDAGTMTLSLEPVALDLMIQECLDLVEPQARARGIRLVNDDGRDRHVHADRQRLKQVLLNLLSNAVKFNRDGGTIRVSADHVPDASTVHVTDTGPGIAPEHLERLFTPFDRLDAEAAGVPGTGLGLALSQRLLEAMGGSIAVDSTPGEGTTFSFTLPVGHSEAAADHDRRRPVPAPTAREASATVLYIEDNLSNLRLVERILQNRPGIRLVSAMQGSIGLELAAQHDPDLILLDVHLPDIGGQEVLERLKADPVTAATPVVVVSADATDGQIRRLREAGAEDYLTKPLDVRRFLAVLDATLDLAPQSP